MEKNLDQKHEKMDWNDPGESRFMASPRRLVVGSDSKNNRLRWTDVLIASVAPSLKLAAPKITKRPQFVWGYNSSKLSYKTVLILTIEICVDLFYFCIEGGTELQVSAG